MVNYSMELYSARNRASVNLMNYNNILFSAVRNVFPNMLSFTVSRYDFTFSVPISPTRSELSKLGKLIAQKNYYLNSIKTINNTGNNLFRKKH